MKRLELLTQTEEVLAQEELSHQLAQDELQLESDLLATQKAVTSKKAQLKALKSAPVLSASDVIKCQDELEGLEKGLEALRALKKELF